MLQKPIALDFIAITCSNNCNNSNVIVMIIIIFFFALGENESNTHVITIKKCLNNIIHILSHLILLKKARLSLIRKGGDQIPQFQ